MRWFSFTQFIIENPLSWIVLAGLALYVASKALSDALVGGRPNMPGRLALGQWLPMAMVAVGAVASGRPAIAMGLIFSSSIACLCLGSGSVALLGLFPEPSPSRRSWTMLLPAALLVFIAGFQGAITLWIAAVFVLQGIVVLVLWGDRKSVPTQLAPAELAAAQLAPIQTAPAQPAPVIAIGKGIGFRTAQFILAIYIAGVGAWFAMHGVEHASAGSEFASPGLLTATLISPLLVLPIIGTGTELAQRKQASMAVDSQTGVVLLNLCALLPIVVFTSYAMQWMPADFKARLAHVLTPWVPMHTFVGTTTAPAIVAFKPLALPLGVWRVDVIMLIALGLFVLPVGLGRWAINKQQGMGMMVGYAVYLALAIMFQRYVLFGVG